MGCSYMYRLHYVLMILLYCIVYRGPLFFETPKWHAHTHTHKRASLTARRLTQVRKDVHSLPHGFERQVCLMPQTRKQQRWSLSLPVTAKVTNSHRISRHKASASCTAVSSPGHVSNDPFFSNAVTMFNCPLLAFLQPQIAIKLDYNWDARQHIGSGCFSDVVHHA